ncbi:Pyruvoyl-dependent arginine decarboxylase [bacterium HR11]|nr:Pyruvoyl-dependent arginine decarboxylase [bacterium HR11]
MLNGLMVPRYAFLTRGVGYHREKLASFEEALRNAGIAPYNLVRVSSIFPPGCELIDREEGIRMLRPGSIVFCVLSENSTNEPGRRIVASVGLALPRDPNLYGYISEHHSFGQTEEEAGEYAEDLAASMLATTLGLEYDPQRAWDEQIEAYRLSGQIVLSRNCTQSAVGDPRGYWTTVVAGVIFILA